LHNQAVVIRSQQRPVCTRRPTGAGGVNGGCARKTPHRHRQADLPSILDCKARVPPCQLAERPNNKRAASARVPSPAVRPTRAASGRGCAALLAANRARCTLCTPRSSSGGPAGGTACLRASGCSGQPGARCVSLCLHQEASTGAQGTQRPLQHREAF
jgi:hypothetical protein